MKTKSWILFALILMLTTGCGGGGTGGPTVAFVSPVTGDTVAEGEPVTLVLAATEGGGTGISRVEVFVNGALLTKENSPAGDDPSLNFSTSWQAGAPGGYNIMAIAYSGDEVASAPATIVITVDGGANSGAQPASASGGEGATTAPAGTEWVQGEASEDAYIRTGPGIYCEIIKTVDAGTIMNLMEYSDSMQYLMTDVLGPTQIGWVWVEQVTILGDESKITRGNKLGCLGCGDSTCSPVVGETCATCEDDCGACCGNGTCEGGFGETCSTCQPDCGSCCGNGTCEAGLSENCSTCEDDCGPCCGNGICEAVYGEDCDTCIDDCGVCIWCGDGICNGDESFFTCPNDCTLIIIPLPYCGDGICQSNEGCNCEQDCGVC